NFQHILKPPATPDTTTSPFVWKINLDAYEIINGTITMYDLTQPQDLDTVTRALNYAHMNLRDVNVATQAHIEDGKLTFWIQHASLNLPDPDIRLIDLAGRAPVDGSGVSVKDLRIETDRTQLVVSARVDSLNVLGNTKSTAPFGEDYFDVDLDGR